MSNNYYVYGLYAPGRSPELFYIGKGRENRLNDHFKPSSRIKNPYKDRIIEKYIGCYAQKLFENLTEQEAFDLEIKLIAKNKDTLTNLTSGGEGTSGYRHTEEAKAKVAMARKGKPHTAKTKAKMSESHKGKDSPWFGKTHTTAARAKMSEAKAGEHSYQAKLTWAIVKEIRARLDQGETQLQIAKDYGVARSQIGRIKANKTWKIKV